MLDRSGVENDPNLVPVSYEHFLGCRVGGLARLPGWAYFWPPGAPVGSGDPVARLGSPGWRPVGARLVARLAPSMGTHPGAQPGEPPPGSVGREN